MPSFAQLVEKLIRPGVQGVAGRTLEKRCAKDLAGYFKKLSLRIIALKLETLAETGTSSELARHAAVMRLTNAVRRERTLLIGVLSVNLQKAMLVGDKLSVFGEADG